MTNTIEESSFNKNDNGEATSKGNNKKGKVKPLYYISTCYSGHFSKLNVKCDKKANLIEQKTFKECLYFENQKDAQDFLTEMKQFIFNFYESKKGEKNIPRPTWLNTEWTESTNWKEYEERKKKKSQNTQNK